MILAIALIIAANPVLDLGKFYHNQAANISQTPCIWPAKGWITSDFGVRIDPYTKTKGFHPGIDISGPDKNVIATADGAVVFAGNEGAYGNVLIIDHINGIQTRYAHLARILVKTKTKVKQGQNVAIIGTTGKSTGPHLHYEVLIHGLVVNPMIFILND